jgi:hypothetical protein
MDLDRSDFEARWRRLASLYDDAAALLAGLDELGLHEAGAHLTMAMHALREAHPDLKLAEPNSPSSE